MANNDQNEEPKQNEEPVEEQATGLTAEEAAGSNPYDEVEVWKKSGALFKEAERQGSFSIAQHKRVFDAIPDRCVS